MATAVHLPLGEPAHLRQLNLPVNAQEAYKWSLTAFC